MGGNTTVCNLLNQANDVNMLIAASGTSPYILGSADIIDGKNITGTEIMDFSYSSFGANFTGSRVEQDGNIITTIAGEK